MNERVKGQGRKTCHFFVKVRQTQAQNQAGRQGLSSALTCAHEQRFLSRHLDADRARLAGLCQAGPGTKPVNLAFNPPAWSKNGKEGRKVVGTSSCLPATCFFTVEIRRGDGELWKALQAWQAAGGGGSQQRRGIC